MKFIKKPIRQYFTRKRFVRISLLLIGLPLVFLLIANYKVESVSEPYVTSVIDSLPEVDVAIVPGTSKLLSSGAPNQYYSFRIDAALKLYESGKIKHFLLSGDHSRKEYNEPEDMKQSLIEGGIPDYAITLDYAGFDTYDSMIRAKEVFGQQSFIVVSQEFQNERAVYIARSFGIDAFGYNAKNVKVYGGFLTKVREFFARGKAFAEVMLGVRPTFLGEKVDLN